MKRRLLTIYALAFSLSSHAQELSFQESFQKVLQDAKPEFNPAKAWHADSLASETKIPVDTKIKASEPVTVVIVPGIFAEMIDTPAFSEVFNNSSLYKAEVELAVEELKKNNRDAPMSDLFDFANLTQKSVPNHELFEFGEIEKENQRLANVVLLKTPYFSLNSVGSMNTLADIYRTRLTRLFKVTGVPSNIILVGYSRGAAIALDMISQNRASTPWTNSVRSLVSLAGVILGSGLSDEANAEGTLSNDLLKNLSTATQELKLVDKPNPKNLAENAKIVAHNTLLITRILEAATKMALFESNPKDKIKIPTCPEFKKLFELATEIFKVQEVFSEYNPNILKFKILLKAVHTGIVELSSPSREQWWSQNTIPNNIHYYALSASFMSQENITEEDYGFNFPSADDKSLYSSYEKFSKFTSDPYNDSQVSVAKSQFDLKKIYELNPMQTKDLIAEDLGTLATHHWGVTLSHVNNSSGLHGPLNSFPRLELFESLVKYAR